MWPCQPQLDVPACVVTLSGDLDLMIADDLREALQRATDGYRNVVLDFTDVRLVDSVGLGVLVRAAQAAKRAGGVVCVANPSRFFLTVLHTMRLERVFPTFDSAEAALVWLDTREPADGASSAKGLVQPVS